MRYLSIIGTSLLLSTTNCWVGNMDGIWRGTNQNGYARSSVELSVVDDTFSIRFWGDLKQNLDQCEFVGRLAKESSAAFLKRNNARNGCEKAPKVAIVRSGPNSLKVSMSGEITQPFDVEVSGQIKQTQPKEMPMHPANFDTLGVSPGMTPTRIRAALKAAGMEETDASPDSLSFADGGADLLVAVFEPVEGGLDSEPPSIAIFRSFKVAENKRLTIDEMDKALTAKYGQPTQSRGGNRQWHHDNQGKLIANQDARKDNWGCLGNGSQQQFKAVAINRVRFEMDFTSGCGVRLFASYDTDADQRVAGVQVQLRDSALALNAAWERRKAPLAELIRAAIEGQQTVRGAPRL